MALCHHGVIETHCPHCNIGVHRKTEKLVKVLMQHSRIPNDHKKILYQRIKDLGLSEIYERLLTESENE